MKKINVFMLPFAGGNKFSYRAFEMIAPEFLKLVPLEYPGRGTRSQEPLCLQIDQLVEDLFDSICQHEQVAEGSYSFYGHSLGGLIACLLARKMRDQGFPLPLHLFVTGTSGPSASSRNERRHLLDKSGFIEELRLLEGCPPELLENRELLEYFEPIIRADFMLSETFRYSKAAILDIPITVITGTREKMTGDDIALWREETSQRVDFKTLPGGHFFILQYTFEVIQIISKKLFPYIKIYSYE